MWNRVATSNHGFLTSSGFTYVIKTLIGWFIPYLRTETSSIQVLKCCSYSPLKTQNKIPPHLSNYMRHTLAQVTQTLYLFLF